MVLVLLIFHSLSIDNFFMSLDLHLTYYPVAVSLDPLIVLFNDFVYLQDQSSGRMICAGCESHGLYQQ